jgi:hypothetical protein
MEEYRLQAADLFKEGKPKNWVSGAIIIMIWVFIVGLIVLKLF